MKKTAVVLIQLGTPDSPKTSDVRRYLSEFLNDPRVIDLPWLARKLLVNGLIVPFRAPKSAKIYKELWDLGRASRLYWCTLKRFRKSLKSDLNRRMSMCIWRCVIKIPLWLMSLEEMRALHYDHVIVLPLFPQYASASSGSAIERAMKIMSTWWTTPEISIVNQFWDNSGYIDSIVERSKAFNLKDYDHILFSYHGLPEKHVDKVYEGDNLCSEAPCETEINDKNSLCYKATSYATTRLIADKLGLKEEDYTVCFQSRLDKKWLTPFSDKVVEEQGRRGAKKLLAFSPAFVADCLETVIEIGHEYQDIFEDHGGEKIQLVPSSNDHERFIDGLEEIIRKKL